MGRRVVTCPLNVQNYSSQVNRRDPFFNDFWSRGCHSFRDQIPNSKDKFFQSEQNNGLLEKSLDLIKEKRESAMVQLAYYQHKLKQGYNANVKLRPLVPSDLVLRKVLGTAKNPVQGKLGPNQEGPYHITSMAGIGAYFLEDLDEHVIPHPWNVNNLKMYYY